MKRRLRRVLGLRWVEDRRFPLVLGVLAILLTLDSLNFGWMIDDHYHHAALDPPQELSALERSPSELFAWGGGSWEMLPEATPWWISDDLRIAFLRPLSGWSHWLDHQLWPDNARWMHLHSLLWFGLTVVAAAWFFRALAPPETAWVAGLAALLFTIEDAHGMPVVWIANRNAVLSMFFGLLALLAHHRWRRHGWRPGALAAPVALLLALLSGEAAVACGAYLFSYAVVLDQGSRRERLVSLLPCALVGVGWQIAYKVLGYGARSSGFYLDPMGDPLAFVGAVSERAPLLLWSQFGFPSADLYNLLPQPVARQVHPVVVGAVVFGAIFLIPLLRRDALARFWGLGLVLSVVPICATLPSQRLLFFTSLGGAGLLALFLVRAWSPRREAPRIWHLAARGLSLPLILIHCVLSPIALWQTPSTWSAFAHTFDQTATTLPSDPEVAEQEAVIVAAPCHFLPAYSVVYQAQQGLPIPEDTLVLATSIYPIEIGRPDTRSLLVRPAGGFLAPVGSAPDDPPSPTLDLRFVYQTFDTITRDDTPFRPGQVLDYRGVTVTVVEVTGDGRPAMVRFDFETSLDHPRFRWLLWQSGGFVPWTPPEIGETTTLDLFAEPSESTPQNPGRTAER